MRRLWAIVPAAGSGSRFGGDRPKQYCLIHGRPVLWHTLTRLACAPGLMGIVVGLAAGDRWWPTVGDLLPEVQIYQGGAERVVTVLNGMAALADAAPEDWVLVHDAVRPCVTHTDLARLLEGGGPDGALLAAPVADTLKRESAGRSCETLTRTGLWRALTPQLFPIAVLRDALEQAVAHGEEVTDEASAVEKQGLRPRLITGRTDNIKITFLEDLELAAGILSRLAREDL